MKLFRLSYLLLLLTSCSPLSTSKGEGETKSSTPATTHTPVNKEHEKSNNKATLSDDGNKKDISNSNVEGEAKNSIPATTHTPVDKKHEKSNNKATLSDDGNKKDISNSDVEGEAKSSTPTKTHTSVNKEHEKNNTKETLSDSERQKNITNADLKDNFNFDQFKDVNWSNTKTFGTPGSYATQTTTPLPDALEQKDFGITKDNYEVIDIKGDGSCFMRASFNAVLYRAFNNQSIFDEIIKNIPIVAKKYENIPGFSQRFRAKDLITLLTTLNNLSESEQLEALNKDKVDTFLNYSFRSLFAARKNSNKDIKELLDVNEWGDVRRAMFDFQEMLVPEHNLALLFPQKGLEEQFSIKIPGENKKIEFTKDYRKKFIDLYDKNIDSKKLEEDYKKAKEEFNKTPNEQKAVIANKYATIFGQNNHLRIIKDIEVFKEKGAKKLKDFYKLEEMSILPYRTAGGNHVQIVIRKEQKSNKIKYLPDDERQKDITNRDLKDNFNFDQFKDVNWSDTKTFGTSGSYATKTNKPMPKDLEMPLFGITGDNYQIVDIKGDGSCFMRASFHAILFRAFENDETFSEFIQNIKLATKKYADSPGFSNRFRADDLITLLTTLKNLSPKQRMQELNKDKVDTFLDYTFRSLNAARSFSLLNEQYSPEDPERKVSLKTIKDNLTNHEFGNHSSAMNNLSHLLPNQDIMYHHASDINVEYAIVIRNESTGFHPKLNNQFLKDMFNKPEISNQQRVKDLKKRNNIENMADFGKIRATAVMPYRTIGGNHVQLIVRKDALEQFGF